MVLFRKTYKGKYRIPMCPDSLGVEHQSCKLEVLGSIPSLGFFYITLFEL